MRPEDEAEVRSYVQRAPFEELNDRWIEVLE